MGIELSQGISIVEAGLKGGMEKVVPCRPPLLPDAGEDILHLSPRPGAKKTNISNRIQRILSGPGRILNEYILKPIRFLLEKIGLYPKTRATAYQERIKKATEKFQQDWEKYTSGLSSVVDPHILAKVRGDAMNNLQKLSEALKKEGITDHEVAMAAHDFQESFLRQIQDFLLAHGTEAQKAVIRKLQAFQRSFETLGHAIPDHMEILALEDLPKPAQDHLRQMILETLRSDLPHLTDWGRRQGRAIGMTEQQIQKVIDTKGFPPPPAGAAAASQVRRRVLCPPIAS